MDSNSWYQKALNTTLKVCNFVDGKYIERRHPENVNEDAVGAACDQYILKHSARNGQLLYRIHSGSTKDVTLAVDSAREAFSDGRWQRLPMEQRKEVLYRLANLIEAHKEEFALYECLDVGKPITHALTQDIPSAIRIIRSSAEGADKLLSPFGPDSSHFVYHVRRPVGVVAGIIGWNYPLTLAAAKVGPALAMGNSLVLKPSEFSALSACRLAELAIEAGVPPGVFNVVNGSGATVGDYLAHHMGVDMLSFTGSSLTGKQMMIAAGKSNMKRLLLECGGKSPYLVFDDCPADLDFVASDIVGRAFANQGELCVASTRLLIQDSIKDQLLPKILAEVKKINPLDPLNPDSRYGALINKNHMNKVLSYINSGIEEGAKLICGGYQVKAETGGYYVEPTIFDNVNPQQKIAQEEIFGPVLSVFTFKHEAEAIELANDSCFGLAAYVASENVMRVARLGQCLNAGLVKIIGSSEFSEQDEDDIDISVAPHKQSGLGAEGGLAGLASYTTSTAVHVLT